MSDPKKILFSDNVLWLRRSFVTTQKSSKNIPQKDGHSIKRLSREIYSCSLICSMIRHQVISRSTSPHLPRAPVISQRSGDARSRIDLFLPLLSSEVRLTAHSSAVLFNSSLLPEASCRQDPAASSLQHCCSVPGCQVGARCMLQCRTPHQWPRDAEITKPLPTAAACTKKCSEFKMMLSTSAYSTNCLSFSGVWNRVIFKIPSNAAILRYSSSVVLCLVQTLLHSLKAVCGESFHLSVLELVSVFSQL